MKLPILLLLALVLYGHSAVLRMSVKKGDRVTIPIAISGPQQVQRTVPAGSQIFHLQGNLKGKLTDQNGKVIKCSNFEVVDGEMVIKKFSETDAGSYGNGAVVKKQTNGTITAVSGNVLAIEIEKD